MITSRHNPRVQLVRKLQAQSKARRDAQAFVVEGVRLAEEALQSGWEAQFVLFTGQLDGRGKAVVDGFVSSGVTAEQVSDGVYKTIGETETPQGILIVLAIHPLPLPPGPTFLLVLDGIRDPGNLGAILRTAAAAGVQGALLAPGCVDAFAPKVVRAAMGAHFRLPIWHHDWAHISRVLSSPPVNRQVYLADAQAGVPYTQADFRSPLALIIGGEATGAGIQAGAVAHARVHIPMPGGSESLNASVAASLLIFEVLRQRGM
ncbi:MAG: TrmH family RNA methyltransferase [Acidobacteriaceae bacterium]